MPMPHINVAFSANVIETGELVVDERLQWCHIQTAYGPWGIFLHQGNDGKESSLCFSRCRRCRKQDVSIGIKDCIACRSLYGTQRLPPLTVDIALYGRRISRKHIHTYQRLSLTPNFPIVRTFAFNLWLAWSKKILGLMVLPLKRISKCRCSVVARPVRPVSPIT